MRFSIDLCISCHSPVNENPVSEAGLRKQDHQYGRILHVFFAIFVLFINTPPGSTINHT